MPTLKVSHRRKCRLALGSEIARVFLLLCGRDLEGFVLFGLGFMWDGMRGFFLFGLGFMWDGMRGIPCSYFMWDDIRRIFRLFLLLCGMK